MFEGKKDFKQEWPKFKKQVLDISEQAVQMAQKGEDELLKFSQRGRFHLNVAALTLKKEHLQHLLGEEYTRAKCPAAPTPKMKRLIAEIEKIEGEEKALEKQMKSNG